MATETTSGSAFLGVDPGVAYLAVVAALLFAGRVAFGYGKRRRKDPEHRFAVVLGDRELSGSVALLVTGGILLAVGGVVFGIMVFVDSEVRQDRRSAEEAARLRGVARQHGWIYDGIKSGVLDELEGVDPFPDASGGAVVHDHVHGRYRGRVIRYFEYRDHSLSTQRNGREDIEYFSVFAVSTPEPFPRTLIQEHGFLDSVFGGGQVVETGEPAFDEDYSVITEDPAAAGKLVTPRLIDHLASDSRLDDLPLRFENGEVVTWHEGRLRSQQVMKRLDYLSGVVDHLSADGRPR
ncbi:hypothetical protein [Streptomyces sp. TR06-5]|uniref:hypothetical protein n=1 Tax=Streptomyces sp. TR06-5 TaxID=3385976 RepID=UPI0039A0F95A